MKELTTEQKAECYDKAIEIAKEINNERRAQPFDVMTRVFPELKESEDEKIRKELIKFVKVNIPDEERYITWLEKQGEKKPIIEMKSPEESLGISSKEYNEIVNDCLYGESKCADKVEPKFHEGDWVVYNDNGGICQIKSIKDDKYCLWPLDSNIKGYLEISDVDNEYHLWDITKDAKDGDVLSYVTDEEDLWIMIYWSLYEPYDGHVHYHALLVNDNFTDKGTCCICIDNLKPATKEQRDTLEKAMADAGYTFDFEKKELKKIIVPNFKIGDTIIKKHNSDIINFGSFTITEITGGKYWYNGRIICDITEQDEWEIYEPVRQKPAELGEEDLPEFESYLCLMLQKFRTKGICTNGEIIDYVKEHSQKLKDTLCHAWSEDDENNILFLTSIIEECFKNKEKITLYSDTVCAHFTKEDVIDRLKSLRPQNRWKPTEEQLDIIDMILTDEAMDDNVKGILKELKEQLKNLI